MNSLSEYLIVLNEKERLYRLCDRSGRVITPLRYAYDSRLVTDKQRKIYISIRYCFN